MKNIPTFLLMGLPNEGKTTLASTLSFDAKLEVSPTSGNTCKLHQSSVRVHGKEQIAFIDSPGIQHTEEIYAWFSKQENIKSTGLGELPKRFVEEHAHDSSYAHECELMRALSHDIGVIYVVDPNRPPSEDDEMMIEVLRWCGNVRAALINPREGQRAHEELWMQLLRRDFLYIRELNGVQASFSEMLAFFKAIRSMKPEWETQMQYFIEQLREARKRQLDGQAYAIMELMDEVLNLEMDELIALKSKSEIEYKLKTRIEASVRELETEFQKKSLKRFRLPADSVVASEIVSLDIFSEDVQKTLGLTKEQLFWTGALAGAILGGAIDACVGGLSFMTGTFAGGALGGALALAKTAFKLDMPSKLKQWMREETYARMRLESNSNCIWALFNKAFLFSYALKERTHGARGKVDISLSAGLVRTWEKEARASLVKLFTLIRSEKSSDKNKLPEAREAVAQLILKQFGA